MQVLPRVRTLAAIVIAVALAGTVAVGTSTSSKAQASKTMTTASGLQIADSKVGTGAPPRPGQTCVMHYPCWLYAYGTKGKKFD